MKERKGRKIAQLEKGKKRGKITFPSRLLNHSAPATHNPKYRWCQAKLESPEQFSSGKPKLEAFHNSIFFFAPKPMEALYLD
ncbi:hypothetical protein ACFX13_010367 [Malus domestica]